MHDTAGSIAMLATPETGLQARAVEEYERSLPARCRDLRWDLTAQVMAVIGRRIPPEVVYADGRKAVAGEDGMTFRLYRHGGLALVRGCEYCGTGHFESPQIEDRSDLGYALSAWHPVHEDCEDYAAEDLADTGEQMPAAQVPERI